MALRFVRQFSVEGLKMGKRGPAPTGEYGDKSQVLSTRIRADTRAALVAAAENSGRSLSQEIEHRLRRTFTDDENIVDAFGSRRNYALMKLIASVIETTANLKRPNADWLDVPYAFDQVTRAIAAVLEKIRPAGELPNSIDDDEMLDHGGRMQWKVNTLEVLRAVQVADAKLPLTKGSRRQHTMAKLKSDIGDIADRAVLYGRTADETRKLSELGRRLAPSMRRLSPLMQKAEETPETMTPDDHRQLNALADEIAAFKNPTTNQKVKPRKRR
jgi:hypothetical protein